MKEKIAIVLSILAFSSLFWGFYIGLIIGRVAWIPNFLFGSENIFAYLPFLLVTLFDIFAVFFSLIYCDIKLFKVMSVIGLVAYFIIYSILLYLASIG